MNASRYHSSTAPGLNTQDSTARSRWPGCSHRQDWRPGWYIASAVANECQILQWECRLLGHLVDSDTIKTAWWAVQKEPESAEHDDILRHDEKLHGRAMCDSFLGWTEILQWRCQPICVLMQLMKPIVMPALGQLGRDNAGGRHRIAVQFLHPRAGSRVPTSKETVSHIHLSLAFDRRTWSSQLDISQFNQYRRAPLANSSIPQFLNKDTSNAKRFFQETSSLYR